MANQQQSTKDSLTKKFDINEDIASRESLISPEGERAQSWSAAGDASGHSTASAGDEQTAGEASAGPTGDRKAAAAAASGSGDAIDLLRTSVAGVLDSVVREYEPQINEFTSSIAHQVVDRGVDLAQTAVKRARAQSWLRLGIAAALGIGIVAVLGYEAEQAAAAPKPRKPLH